jgi:hypothetical protein
MTVQNVLHAVEVANNRIRFSINAESAQACISPKPPHYAIPPLLCRVKWLNSNPDPTWKSYYPLSLPHHQGPDRRSKGSLRFIFVGSKLLTISHEHCREKDHLQLKFSFDPPRLTLLKPSQITDSSAAELFRISPSGGGIHRRYSKPQASQH